MDRHVTSRHVVLFPVYVVIVHGVRVLSSRPWVYELYSACMLADNATQNPFLPYAYSENLWSYVSILGTGLHLPD
jgi:hypothetical protein